MVKLNKIYTRTGDAGETGLGDGSRTPKNSLRVAAYGAVDEANAHIGMALVAIQAESDLSDLSAPLLRIQNDLFDLGADLCVPEQEDEEPGANLRITADQVTALERDIYTMNTGLSPLNSFVLPGGTEAAARLHVARTQVRRAERAITTLTVSEAVNPNVMRYINRLSDLLFVMARWSNGRGQQDVLWTPGGDR